MKEGKLPVKVKLGFGVCDLGGNLLFTVGAFWIMHYLTDNVGLSAGLAGLSMAIGNVWDAVTDPVMGYVSDRTVTKWGRRRPYMFIGAILTFIAMVILWTNPGITNQILLFIWAACAYSFLKTAYTLVNIPYSSLTPEMTSDFHEQTSLNSFRSMFMVVGTLLGAGAALPIVGLFADKNHGYSFMGTLFGALMMITAIITVIAIKEKNTHAVKSKLKMLEAYKSALKTKPFLFLLFTWMMSTAGITVMSGTLVYYFKYIYKNEALTTVALLVLLVTVIFFIPVWVQIAKRIGKKESYLIGLMIMTGPMSFFFLFGHKLPVQYAFVAMFFAGIGLTTHYILPWAIIPDVVEYNYSMHDEKIEGSFYALWSFFSKSGQALAGALIGGILSVFHYMPDVPQTAASKFGIRLLISPIPIFLFILGMISLYKYPITKKVYDEIVLKIKEKDKRMNP